MSQTAPNNRIGILYGCAAALAFAAYTSINSYVYQHYKVGTFDYTATFMMAGGAFALVDLLAGYRGSRPREDYNQVARMVLNGILGGTAIGLVVFGQRYTTAVNASIIVASGTIPTMIFSRFMLKESLSRRQLNWLAIMFVGLYFAVVGGHLLSFNKGDLIALAAALILGFTNTYSKILMRQSSSKVVADMRLVTGGVMLAAIGLIISGTGVVVSSAGLWPLLAGFFFWLTIKAFYASVGKIGPNRAIVLTNSHPIITPFVGVLLLSEPYSWIKAVGSVVMLISVYFISKKQN